MPDKRDLLQVLRAELSFLEQGGYRKAARYPWRPNFAFEDSPTCINFHDQEHLRPCSECLLMHFVPDDRRDVRYPCRHIPLTSRGETVNSFYEWGTEDELEAALRSWLRQKIHLMESGAKASSQTA